MIQAISPPLRICYTSSMSSCQECANCGHGVLGGVGSEALELWNRSRRTREVKRGEILFHEGEMSAGVYCTYSGLTKLYRTAQNGEVQILQLVGGMRVLGHSSVICDEPMACTAEVVRPGRLCLVDRQVALKCMELDARLGVNLCRLLSRELLRAEDQWFARSCLSTRSRLARLLLELHQGGTWIVEMTRAEMGQMIGASAESISRVLQEMESTGIIQLEKRKIALRDVPALTNLGEL